MHAYGMTCEEIYDNTTLTSTVRWRVRGMKATFAYLILLCAILFIQYVERAYTLPILP